MHPKNRVLGMQNVSVVTVAIVSVLVAVLAATLVVKPRIQIM